jgi:hypothetical protein
VHTGEAEFIDVMRDSGQQLDLSGLVYFARWITPEIMPKRYDTAFFAAAMPDDQEAVAAAGEVESVEWLTPARAIEQAGANGTLMPPTRAALTALEGHPRVDDALRGLRTRRDLTPILPRVVAGSVGSRPGEIQVLMPGDPGYDAG